MRHRGRRGEESGGAVRKLRRIIAARPQLRTAQKRKKCRAHLANHSQHIVSLGKQQGGHAALQRAAAAAGGAARRALLLLLLRRWPRSGLLRCMGVRGGPLLGRVLPREPGAAVHRACARGGACARPGRCT